MPQPFNNTTITEDGIKLLNKAQAGEAAVEFTRIAVGDGQYQMDDGSITQLWKLKGLKSERNTYSLSSVSVHSEGSVRITALITNCDPITGEVLVTEGYHINEMGLYAKEKGKEGSEVLYSVSVASGGKGDFMPPYNGYPAEISQELYVAVSHAEETTIQCDRKAPALAVDLQEHMGDMGAHITPEEKAAWDAKQEAMTVDSSLSATSTNPIQNKAVKKALDGKASTGHTHAAASTASPGFMQAADKRKLDGIAENANSYTHPSSHPASMITLDATHRFVTDAEKQAWDALYAQLVAYTDGKIADLIGGAPATLDTLKEIADAVAENKGVDQALNEAIGKKASQAELDTHTGNSTIHVTATDKGNWDKAMGERTVTFTQATGRANIASGEKLSTILGKVRKFFADLKAVAFTGSYNDLEDKPGAKDIGAAQVGQVYHQDFSTILEPGLYWVYCGGGSNGRPDSSCDTYALVVVGNASRSITQIAASVPGGEVFINTKAGDSGWAGWRQVGAGLPRAADTSDAPRKLWFDSPGSTDGEGKLAYNTDLTFNPANHNLKVANFNSNVISQARASYTRNTWYKVAFHGYSDVGWGSCIIDLKRVYNTNTTLQLYK